MYNLNLISLFVNYFLNRHMYLFYLSYLNKSKKNEPILQICPECNKHTKVELDKDNIHINCECGYNYTMNVKQY